MLKFKPKIFLTPLIVMEPKYPLAFCSDLKMGSHCIYTIPVHCNRRYNVDLVNLPVGYNKLN